MDLQVCAGEPISPFCPAMPRQPTRRRNRLTVISLTPALAAMDVAEKRFGDAGSHVDSAGSLERSCSDHVRARALPSARDK